MDRRAFLTRFGLLIAGVAIEQAIPLNRVWSFPSEIVIAPNALVGAGELTREAVSSAYCVALQLEKVRDKLPLLFERDSKLFAFMEGPEGLTIAHVIRPEEERWP